MKKTIDVKVERTIAASPGKVFAGWLNPKIPGTPWNMGKVILNPKVDGFFYWLVHNTPHYGRFTKLDRARKIQHTWMSPYTNGNESVVTVSASAGLSVASFCIRNLSILRLKSALAEFVFKTMKRVANVSAAATSKIFRFIIEIPPRFATRVMRRTGGRQVLANCER